MKNIYVFDRDQGVSHGRKWTGLVGAEFQFVQFNPSNDRNRPSTLKVCGAALSSPFVLVIHGPRDQNDPVVKAASRLAEADPTSRVIVVGGTILRGTDGPRVYFRKAVLLNASKESPDPCFAQCFSEFMDDWSIKGASDWSKLEPSMRIPEELAAWALWKEAEALGLTKGKSQPEALRQLSLAVIKEQYEMLANQVGGEQSPWSDDGLPQVKTLLKAASHRSE